MSFQVATNIYTKDSKEAVETIYCELKKQGKKFYCRFDELEVLVTDQYKIMANQDLKVVVFSELSEEEELGLKQFNEQAMAGQMDSLLSKDQTVTYKGMKYNCKHYQIKRNALYGIREIDVFLQPDNLLLKRMEYVHLQKVEEEVTQSRVVIEYKNCSLNPNFAADAFSEKHFFNKNGEAFSLSSKYQQFELINANDYGLSY